MATITRSAHPSALWPGVKAWFGTNYKDFPTIWTQIFERQTSDKAWEDLVETSGFGLAPVKTEGAPIQYDTDAEGYKTRLTHTVYGLGCMVTREELEDNQYLRNMRTRTRKLARSMRVTQEVVHANVLNRAFSTAYAGGDGAAIISAAHPGPGGNRSNLAATVADLSEASLEDMLTQISTAKDNRGLPIMVRGAKLVIHPSNAFNAERILNSTMRSGSANNDINAIRSMGLVSGGVVVNPYLTDPDAWFLITDADDGLVSMWRRDVELQQDSDFDTENAKAKATMRFLAGVGDWMSIFGTPGV